MTDLEWFRAMERSNRVLHEDAQADRFKAALECLAREEAARGVEPLSLRIDERGVALQSGAAFAMVFADDEAEAILLLRRTAQMLEAL